MSSSGEDNHGIEVYFTAAEFAKFSEYERLRMRNMKQNYEMMIKVGLNVPPPDFMRPSVRKKNKISYDDSDEDADNWQSVGSRSRKKTFKVPLKNRGQKREMKKPETFSRPPMYDSDDAFEQLANINISDFEDDETLCTVEQAPCKKRKTTMEMQNETGTRRYSLREGTRKSYKDLEAAEDDIYVFCEDCHELYEDDCPSHPLTVIEDTPVPSKCKNRAKLSLPPGLVVKEAGIEGAGVGVWTEKFIPKGVRFGPYGGEIVVNERVGRESGYAWEIFNDKRRTHYINGRNKHKANWMRYVNCARNESEQNLIAYQYRGQIYYRSLKPIYAGKELLVYYGEEYAKELGIEEEKFKNDGTYHECEICSIAFTGRLFLLKHLKYRHRQHVDLTMYQSRSSPMLGRTLCKVESSQQSKHNATTVSRTRTVTFHHLANKCKESKGEMTDCDLKSSHDTSSQSVSSHQHMNGTNKVSVEKIHGSDKVSVRKIHDRTSYHEDNVSGNGIQRHLQHSADKPYQCNVCSKQITKKCHLITHMRIHTGERPYQCDTCGKGFSVQSNLKVHVMTHTGIKPYQCMQCNKTCTQKIILIRHMRIHTGETPYQCDTCGKGFNQQSILNRHVLIHEGIKPYQCMQCNKTFIQKHDLTRHMRIHTGEKPFKCHTCGKAFAHKSSLERHKRIHSEIKP